jgi:osmoprotectant transport system substrate-binding protein
MAPRHLLRRSPLSLVALLAVGAFGLSACGGSSTSTSAGAAATDPASHAPIVVAAFGFGESKILANMYADVLNKAGYNASVKELTTREVVAPALEKGDVDVVPEYIGTYTEYLNVAANGANATPLASNDPAKTLAKLTPLAQSVGVVPLQYAAAQDENSFAVTKDFATQNNLTTLSDLAAMNMPLVLGGPPECPKRPFCEPGLVKTYGLTFSDFKALDAGGPLTKQAIADGTVDLGLVFSSDGGIADLGLQVLTDDKGLQTADNVIPVVNAAAYDQGIADALNAVSAQLTTADLVDLNKQVDIDRKQPADVALTWLQSKGLA